MRVEGYIEQLGFICITDYSRLQVFEVELPITTKRIKPRSSITIDLGAVNILIPVTARILHLNWLEYEKDSCQPTNIEVCQFLPILSQGVSQRFVNVVYANDLSDDVLEEAIRPVEETVLKQIISLGDVDVRILGHVIAYLQVDCQVPNSLHAHLPFLPACWIVSGHKTVPHWQSDPSEIRHGVKAI